VWGDADHYKLHESPYIKKKVGKSRWIYICYDCCLYIVAFVVCFASYSAVKAVIGVFENKATQAKYEAEYEVYRNSLCDLLSSEGLTNRECGIPLERMIDPGFPKDVERVLNNVLHTDGIKAQWNNVQSSLDINGIFRKIMFHKVAPDGFAIADSKASLTDVSLVVNKYLTQKRHAGISQPLKQ
jgi:hypothetical protein